MLSLVEHGKSILTLASLKSDVYVRELIGYNTRIGYHMIHETQHVYI